MASGAPASDSTDFGDRLSGRQYRAPQHCKRLDLIRAKGTWVNFQFLPVRITLSSSSLIDRLR